MLLIDASTLRQPGGTGDDWRWHLAYDFTAGRLGQVRVTDRYGGESLDPFALQPGASAVADNGYGYRTSVASAVRQQAHVVLRVTPATFPVETADGAPFAVVPGCEPQARCCGSGMAGVAMRTSAMPSAC